MSVDEQSRYNMHQRLEAVLGAETAAALMAHLPPVGWGDVATRRDLDMMRRDLEAVEQRLLAVLYRELNAQTRTLVLSMLGMVFTAVSLTYVAVRLA